MEWNSAQYLKFRAERTQPAVDLAARIPLKTAARVLDIGCGPGNSTRALARRFPGAQALGVDSSPQMIETARRENPGLSFEVRDAGTRLDTLPADFDVVFSNACIQWIPDHPALLRAMLSRLRPGGWLAVQVPMNFEEPIHKLVQAAVTGETWRAHFPHPRTFYTLTPEQYIDRLSESAGAFTVWETTYFHMLPSHRAILEWYSGTALRPYLAVLNEAEKAVFSRDILSAIERHYPARGDGSVVFRFPRFFFLAQRA